MKKKLGTLPAAAFLALSSALPGAVPAIAKQANTTKGKAVMALQSQSSTQSGGKEKTEQLSEQEAVDFLVKLNDAKKEEVGFTLDGINYSLYKSDEGKLILHTDKSIPGTRTTLYTGFIIELKDGKWKLSSTQNTQNRSGAFLDSRIPVTSFTDAAGKYKRKYGDEIK